MLNAVRLCTIPVALAESFLVKAYKKAFDFIFENVKTECFFKERT